MWKGIGWGLKWCVVLSVVFFFICSVWRSSSRGHFSSSQPKQSQHFSAAPSQQEDQHQTVWRYHKACGTLNLGPICVWASSSSSSSCSSSCCSSSWSWSVNRGQHQSWSHEGCRNTSLSSESTKINYNLNLVSTLTAVFFQWWFMLILLKQFVLGTTHKTECAALTEIQTHYHVKSSVSLSRNNSWEKTTHCIKELIQQLVHFPLWKRRRRRRWTCKTEGRTWRSPGKALVQHETYLWSEQPGLSCSPPGLVHPGHPGSCTPDHHHHQLPLRNQTRLVSCQRGQHIVGNKLVWRDFDSTFDHNFTINCFVLNLIQCVSMVLLKHWDE